MQDELEELRSHVHELQAELEEKQKKKDEHLNKWDWLEGQYNLKCQALLVAEESLTKVQDELRDICTHKDKQIEQLEDESKAKEVDAEVYICNTIEPLTC